MLIRKLFRFENAHVVRGCTRRCSHSIHGHSYRVELLLEAHALDHGQMIYDFGLLKGDVRDLIDAFDHAVTLWSDDDPCYVESMRRHSERWVLLPVSPSAEQFSRVFFRLVDAALSGTRMTNGEADDAAAFDHRSRDRDRLRAVLSRRCVQPAHGPHRPGRHRVRAGHRRTVARSGPVRAYQARPPHFKAGILMIRKNPRGDLPQIRRAPSSIRPPFCAETVIVEENVFIGPYAVIRADETDAGGRIAPIVIGAHSNIQDGVVIHSKSGASVTIGEHTSIAHRAIVHRPCKVGNGVFVGFNSVLFNCTIDDGCVVRYNAVVDGCHLPPGFYVRSTERIGPETDLAALPQVTADASDFSEDVARTNNALVLGYKLIRTSSESWTSHST